MKEKPVILVIYDYFYPGYKAGGPVQSITNLVVALQDQYSFHVLTSAYDIHESRPHVGIVTDTWFHVTLPGLQESIPVWYATKGFERKVLQGLIQKGDVKAIYLNGIFSFNFFICPLLAVRKLLSKPRIVICPRGMLQKGALAVKPLKKRAFLSFLRFTRFSNNVAWHATNQEEAADIKRQFPLTKEVCVAANIPKPPYTSITFPKKQQGSLHLVYLSLITKKKNLLFVLDVMRQCKGNISLDIYGPQTDAAYWQKSEELIRQLQGRVRYCGNILPADVQPKLAEYHALILLTQGENFGHALYESLSVGRPIITSHFTPWNDLKQKKAGLNVDITSIENCIEAISDLKDMKQNEFDEYCKGALNVASEYFNSIDAKSSYKRLFL